MAKPTTLHGLSRRTSLARAGPRILAAHLADLQRPARDLPAEEAVHAMRVASRRLRAALPLLGLRELDGQVKKLQDALGALRDLQAQHAWLLAHDPALARQQASLQHHAARQLADAIVEWQSRALPSLLESVAGLSKRGKLGGHRARKKLRRALRKLEDRKAAAEGTLAPRPVHRLRIALKRLRYLCELLSPALKIAASLLGELPALQELLGELHGVDLRIALLRRHRRSMLLRGEELDRDRLASLVSDELSRWSRRRLIRRALRKLR